YLAFGHNCFFDEVAEATGRDPVALRLDLLGEPRSLQFYRSSAPTHLWTDTGRFAQVIRRTAELAGWDAPVPPGAGRGFAAHVQSTTCVGLVAEVHAREGGGWRIARMT